MECPYLCPVETHEIKIFQKQFFFKFLRIKSRKQDLEPRVHLQVICPDAFLEQNKKWTLFSEGLEFLKKLDNLKMVKNTSLLFVD